MKKEMKMKKILIFNNIKLYIFQKLFFNYIFNNIKSKIKFYYTKIVFNKKN